MLRQQLSADIGAVCLKLTQAPSFIKIVTCYSNPQFAIILTFCEDKHKKFKKELKFLCHSRDKHLNLYGTYNCAQLIREDGTQTSH